MSFGLSWITRLRSCDKKVGRVLNDDFKKINYFSAISHVCSRLPKTTEKAMVWFPTSHLREGYNYKHYVGKKFFRINFLFFYTYIRKKNDKFYSTINRHYRDYNLILHFCFFFHSFYYYYYYYYRKNSASGDYLKKLRLSVEKLIASLYPETSFEIELLWKKYIIIEKKKFPFPFSL